MQGAGRRWGRAVALAIVLGCTVVALSAGPAVAWPAWLRPSRWELKAGYGWQYTNRFRPNDFQVISLLPSFVVPVSDRIKLLCTHGQFEWNPELLLATFQYPYVRPILGITPLQFQLSFDPIHRVQPYLLAGAGVLYANVNRIEAGSKANFNLQVGAGLRYPISKETSLLVEYRHVHVSNAGLDNPNHGLNMHNFYLGVSVKR